MCNVCTDVFFMFTEGTAALGLRSFKSTHSFQTLKLPLGLGLAISGFEKCNSLITVICALLLSLLPLLAAHYLHMHISFLYLLVQGLPQSLLKNIIFFNYFLMQEASVFLICIQSDILLSWKDKSRNINVGRLYKLQTCVN
jgi:hypothetical protein